MQHFLWQYSISLFHACTTHPSTTHACTHTHTHAQTYTRAHTKHTHTHKQISKPFSSYNSRKRLHCQTLQKHPNTSLRLPRSSPRERRGRQTELRRSRCRTSLDSRRSILPSRSKLCWADSEPREDGPPLESHQCSMKSQSVKAKMKTNSNHNCHIINHLQVLFHRC